jgi:hypothetical protein
MSVRRKRVLSNFFCVIAVLFGGTATRTWHSYLPAQADDLAKLVSNVGQTVAIVERAAGDLPQLVEQTYKDSASDWSRGDLWERWFEPGLESRSGMRIRLPC